MIFPSRKEIPMILFLNSLLPFKPKQPELHEPFSVFYAASSSSFLLLLILTVNFSTNLNFILQFLSNIRLIQYKSKKRKWKRSKTNIWETRLLTDSDFDSWRWRRWSIFDERTKRQYCWLGCELLLNQLTKEEIHVVLKRWATNGNSALHQSKNQQIK